MVDTYTGGPAKPTIDKDPDAVLDYSFDFAPWLTPLSDTIASADFILETPLEEDRRVVETLTAVVWLKGGVPGSTHRATCRITTTAGRVDDRSIFLKIKQR